MNELQQLPENAVVESPSVIALLERAIDRGDVDVAALEKLVDLHERIEKRSSERAFNDALRRFKSDCPVIDKPTTADAGPYKYKFATFGYLTQRIAPFVARHGFSYSFDTEYATDSIKVVCIVSHVSGHRERSTFTAPIDTAAKMNPTQRAASATSYGKRYALLGAFGIATAGDDDAVSLDARRIDADEFVALKRRWFKTIDKQQTKLEGARTSLFTDWACGLIGREFDAANINNWTYTDFVVCDSSIFEIEKLTDGDTINVGDAADDILSTEEKREIEENEKQQTLL